MKTIKEYGQLLGILVALLLITSSVCAQEVRQKQAPDTTVLEKYDEVINDARITLFKDKNFGGNSIDIYLKDGARVILNRNCRQLYKKVSSLILEAPRRVSITVYQTGSCYNCKTYTGTWWGWGTTPRKVNQRTLKFYGVHDNITYLEFRVDGYLPNSKFQYPCN